MAVLRVASQVVTDWVLLLDDTALSTISVEIRAVLLNPPHSSIPVGPRGFRTSCVAPSRVPEKASYLVPPFVMPRTLAYSTSRASDSHFWRDFGTHIAFITNREHGGVVLPFSPGKDPAWCRPPKGFGALDSLVNIPHLPSNSSVDSTPRCSVVEDRQLQPVFIILFPTLSDLQTFASVPCQLQRKGFLVYAAVYSLVVTSPSSKQSFSHGSCVIQYSILSEPQDYSLQVYRIFGRPPDIVLSLNELELATTSATRVRLPRRDLPYCVWMGALSFSEWRNWNIPQVDVSVITKDRPHSLARLLSSFASGRFYGDRLDLRINLEQSSDDATVHLARNFQWIHGSVFMHHRVIHGGLLPAVVESWYPNSNHSYGLLLEDDVELSPLFYAWIKMTILRYRYGEECNVSPQLFGVSLYQQKHIELHSDGRRKFDARALFKSLELPVSSPYLSQIPCSWGAVYFPEHWREFHDYLSVRFSELSLKIDATIVPEVRSNQWRKSWKKYFIELVYLRGYVMLYPNFADFVSLSTNHLEVGSHVKDRSKEKRDLFLLPLMQLTDGTEPSVLLDLPGKTLPEWRSLPVLNLTGSITSLESVVAVGRAARSEMFTECAEESSLYRAQQLMCVEL
ncbi:uncharacterized protein EV420DRAFT_1508285 [Desarmillaria tabescens]|uniref:Uncharacterized protein n=1 Tax=Armillaria tabescens TaxID=1929756 RepID=A0AA39T695_ARMTA|nr:uncharacterized protein EV420DRAFT_1508285 [Desarmillaria tabescens]KAK0467366.1 hypothetical protein EV420DRAFT_1508285 [Desarmillaria tabescens]